MKISNEELASRARIAYRRSGGVDQPSGGGDVSTHDGRTYVVLSNSYRTLGVFEVLDDGRKMKHLQDLPAAVSENKTAI